MRAFALLLAACQPVIDLEVDPSVQTIAVVTLAEDGSIETATALLPVDAILPHQPNVGRALLYGFDDSIGTPSGEPVRFAGACDRTLPAIWTAERSDGAYRTIDDAPPLTGSWLEAKCAADQVCLSGECRIAIVDIDAGANSACALWSSGEVSCWGHNGYGQLGRSEHEINILPEPALVPGIDDAIELSAGDSQVCVRRPGGRLTCWGPDFQGEALMNVGPVQGLPRAVMGVDDAITMSAGESQVCLVTEAAKGECFGRNDFGELGDGTMERRGIPVEVIGLENAAQAGTGSEHTCFRTTEGQVLCWGNNARAQLGPGSGNMAEPIRTGAKLLDTGANHNCVVLENGDVSCWGDNGWGQLGGGSPQLSAPAISVDLGLETSCAVLEEGAVECWGATKHAELPGLESTPFFFNIPVAAPVSTESIDVAVGHVFACTLDVDRAVWCWGANSLGELGNGKSGEIHQREIAFEGSVEEIAAGDEMTCARSTSGDVHCWGHNQYGQLGRATQTLLEPPGRVMLPGRAIDIAAGVAHACAVLENGDAYCWGDNYDGQVSVMNDSSITEPQRVLTQVSSLALGDYHSCAILADRTVSCWGSNAEGATNHDDPAPAIVPAGDGAIAGDAGLDQTCVLRQDRTVRCWGDRGGGEEQLAGVDQIAVGRRYSCARIAGSIRCWGDNDHGQLGDGTFAGRETPMPVLGISDATAILMGSSHVCAIVNGELWCWGDNNTSQLNDGNWPTDRSTAARVEGLSGVRFGDGFRHHCVYLDAGRVECWGWNEWGQVGAESAAIEKVATRAVGLDPR